MTIIIRNKKNGMKHIEKHVTTIKESDGHINLIYDGTYGCVSGCKYPRDTYAVEELRIESSH